jgi:hypothetical protein
MQHLWSKAVDGLDLSIGSLLDQAVYHPCDAFSEAAPYLRHLERPYPLLFPGEV